MRSATWDLVLVTGSKSFAIRQWTKMPAAHGKAFEGLDLSADCPYKQLVSAPERSYEIEKYQILWQALTGESTLPEPRLYVNEPQKKVAEKILDFTGLRIKDFCLCFPAGT